jgi:predicted DNA-binding protein with PD1-like motif
MECRQFGSKLVVRIDKGEEILTVIRSLYQSHGIKLASISGIGAVSRANIGIFIQDTKEYRTKELTGSMEIVSMAGNISEMDGKCYIHCHITLTDENYQAWGGHLNEAVVGPTCEMVIDIIDGQVDRKFNETVGLNLIKFD